MSAKPIKDEVASFAKGQPPVTAIALKSGEGEKPGTKYALVRGKRKVGEARRSKLNGVWIGYKWGKKDQAEVARAQALSLLLAKMEHIV